MTIKSLLLIGTLALASIASAKSYDIVLQSAATAGKVQLSAGTYSLKVQGSNAVFTNVETGKSYTTAVKVEAGDRTFRFTAVDTQTQNGADQIKSIELAGSNTQLELGE